MEPKVEPKNEVKKQYNNNVIGVWNWILTFIILAIPILNLVMLFIWAFGGTGPISKRNYARATLILIVITTALTIYFWSTLVTSINYLK